jgi:pre-mRNA-processing factor 6
VIIRQALDVLPQSVELWKLLINETEKIEDVRILMAKATQTVQLSEELWLSYARVSEPQDAQQILNMARKAMPTSSKIWIYACRLQEQLGNVSLCDKIMERAVKSLIKENAMPSREDWIAEAENSEAESCPATAGAIIKATVSFGLDDDDERRDIFLEDVKRSTARGMHETARATVAYAVNVFPYSTTVWHAWADLEKRHGTQDALLALLEKAVNACPNSETLWLLYTREMWQAGRMDDARAIVGRSFNQLPGNENLYLRAIDLEIDAGQTEMARNLFKIARESAGTDRLYMKSAQLERELGNFEGALDLCNEGLQMWPGSWKLHAIKGQIYESLGKLKEATESYSVGSRANPKAHVLFILLSRAQEKSGTIVRARSTLDKGIQQNPNNPELLCELVRLERRQNNIPAAQKTMAAALQSNPTSGLLWAEKIMHLEARTQRKPRALEAIKKVENDPLLFVVVARIFWAERRLDKASTWFLKAITLQSDFGDAWVWYYKFLLQHGKEETIQDTIQKAVLAEPKYGEIWQSVAKDPKFARKGVEEILKIAVERAE